MVVRATFKRDLPRLKSVADPDQRGHEKDAYPQPLQHTTIFDSGKYRQTSVSQYAS